MNTSATHHVTLIVTSIGQSAYLFDILCMFLRKQLAASKLFIIYIITSRSRDCKYTEVENYLNIHMPQLGKFKLDVLNTVSKYDEYAYPKYILF